MKYSYNLATSDNGNVASIANNRNTNRSQSFTYDELNRIKTAQSAATSGSDCWGLQFGYDIWANLLSASVTKCSAPPLSVGVNTKNQINNTGFQYDAAGNLTFDGSLNSTYDAENRIVSSNAGVTYSYDGDGRRVKKSNGKLYWYGASSDPLEETDLAGTATADFIFFNGKRTARLDLPGAVVHYYFANHLGTANVVTSSTGTIQDESDFYAFGGERTVSDSDPNPYKFTGKERDTESGLDFFGARYYGSSLGRFMSPDPGNAGAFYEDPQSWSGYAYARNNPLRYSDPDGRSYCQIETDDDGIEFFVNCISDDDYKKDPAKYDAAGYVRVVMDTTIFVEPEKEKGPAPAWYDLPGQFFVAFGDCVLNASAGGCGRLALNVGSSGLAALPFVRTGGALLTIGSGLRLGQVANIVSRASSAIGNQTIRAESEAVVAEAVDTFLGAGKEIIRDRGTGAFAGWKSADGTRVVIWTHADKVSGIHMNFHNFLTGGNLHVSW